MTTEELHDLIHADAAAKAMADAGNDAGAAIRAIEIAPVIVVSMFVTERTIYATLGPTAGETFLATLEGVGQSNAVVARAVSWLAPPSDGIDVGDQYTRAMLDTLAAGEVLTAESVAAIKALAERPANITADQVSAAWKNSPRPNVPGGGV